MTEGEVLFEGKNLLEMAPEERAREGIVPGLPVSGGNSRREQHLFPEGGAQRNAQNRGQPELDAMDFLELVKEKMKLLELDPRSAQPRRQRRFLRRRKEAQRDFPDGRAGTAGSAILDETDSGLDIDALQDRGRRRQQTAPAGNAPCIVITHYQRLLNYIVPDFVHVLYAGASSSPAARSWPTNWRSAATIGWRET